MTSLREALDTIEAEVEAVAVAEDDLTQVTACIGHLRGRVHMLRAVHSRLPWWLRWLLWGLVRETAALLPPAIDSVELARSAARRPAILFAVADRRDGIKSWLPRWRR